MSVTYTATLSVRAETVLYLSRSRHPSMASSPRCSSGFNKARNGLRAIGERGNSLLKMTFRALHNVSLDPWRIGAIVAAALVLLHYDHARTT